MLLKIVSLFLVAIAVLGMFGKLHLIYRPLLPKSAKCKKCGTPRVGKAPCPCETKG